MIGDIAKMFHSIDLPLLDQMTHRFLWRDFDERREPDTHVMTAINMGDHPWHHSNSDTPQDGRDE